MEYICNLYVINLTHLQPIPWLIWDQSVTPIYNEIFRHFKENHWLFQDNFAQFLREFQAILTRISRILKKILPILKKISGNF